MIWIGVREWFSYALNRNHAPIEKFGEYHRNIIIIISIVVILNYIIGGWSIRDLPKIQLMLISIHEVTKGNIMKVVLGIRIVEYFWVTQNIGLGCFW